MEQNTLTEPLTSLSSETSNSAPSHFWQSVRTNVRLKQQTPPITAVPRDGKLPLSFNQERLWLLEQMQPDNSVHNLLHTIHFQGPLNITALEQSLNEIVRRHEILRTRFSTIEGHPVQTITAINVQLPLEDLRSFPLGERAAIAHQLASAEAEQPFNLEQGPLWRFKLFRLSETEHLLSRTIHHIIFDGWSHSVFQRELAVLYEAFVTGQSPALPELFLQYADFAAAQRRWFEEEVFAAQLDYWKQHLSGKLNELKLPTHYPRPAVSSYQGERQSLTFSSELTTALKRLSYQQGVSLFALLLTIFKVWLHRYSQQEDMLICSPVANRNRPELKGLLGYFNNVVVLRSDLSGDPSFEELLKRVSQVSLEANANQDIPLQHLVELPGIQRISLTRAMFVLQNTPNQVLQVGELTITSDYIERAVANVDLSLSMQEKNGCLTGAVQYKTDLFNTAAMAEMLHDFQQVVEEALANPNQLLSQFPLFQSSKLETSDEQQPLSSPYVAPRDAVEQTLTEIWQQTLGLETVGLRDNFFAVGGHSLLAVQLFLKVEQAFNRHFPLSTLFQAPTIEQLATIIRQEDWSAQWECLVPIQPEGSKLPLFCMHGGGLNPLVFQSLAERLGSDQPVYGLQAKGLDGKAPPHERIEDMAADYIKEMQMVQPQGPYFLAGLSNGGVIALEIAQQLRAQGQSVALVAMFDTYGPCKRQLLPPLPRLFSTLIYVLRYTSPRVLQKLQKQGLSATLAHLHKKLKRSQQSAANQPATSAATLPDLNPLPDIDGVAQLPTKSKNKLESWINRFHLLILKNSPLAFHAPSADLAENEGVLTFNIKQVEKSHNTARIHYQPKPYNGRIILFRATEQPPGFHRDPYFGWREIALNGIEIHDVPGFHAELAQSPVLAQKLRIYLEHPTQTLDQQSKR